MKKIRIFTVIFLAILVSNFQISKMYGQVLTSPVDASNQISQEDFKSILMLLHIDFFKFNTNFPFEQKCNIVLYRQEYEKKKLIKESTIWGTSNPYRDMQDGKLIERALSYVRIIAKRDDRNFSIAIRMGDFELADYKLVIDSAYQKPHACKPFKVPSKFNDGDKVPLLLIGSFWDSTSADGKRKIERFCMENELESDFSNKAFDEMPHYIVFGIKIEGA
jgi:predicted nucleic acid-binding protein